jgi:hypothetical protein
MGFDSDQFGVEESESDIIYGLKKAQLIFGPDPSQWRQPVLLKNEFYFLEIIRIFQIFFTPQHKFDVEKD